MRPRVFLSHSKADKTFIERVAGDLRPALTDVWYDEWEIPAGSSFRREITGGIEDSDLFFVYLTPHSAGSYWVQHELDTAFVLESNERRKALALFVSDETTRKTLPSDLQSIHSPIFNDDEYLPSFSKLVARAWESMGERRIEETKRKARLRQIELENENKTLQLTIARASMTSMADIPGLMSILESMKFRINNLEVSLQRVFQHLALALATSASLSHLQHLLLTRLGAVGPFDSTPKLWEVSEYTMSDIVGPLIIRDLVQLDPSHGEVIDDYYFLTELGKRVAKELLDSPPNAV